MTRSCIVQPVSTNVDLCGFYCSLNCHLHLFVSNKITYNNINGAYSINHSFVPVVFANKKYAPNHTMINNVSCTKLTQ